jgi:hypothetical protein
MTMTKRSLLAAFMFPMLFGAYLLLAQEEGRGKILCKGIR